MKKATILFVTIYMAGLFQTSFAQGKTHHHDLKSKQQEWFDSGQWSSGLGIKPHPSINIGEFYKQYHLSRRQWEEAFAFIRNSDLQKMAPGKYTIDGDRVYATITEGPTKNFRETLWEAHRDYIDLHYVIRGQEKIGMGTVRGAVVTVAYDASKDIAHYQVNGKFYLAKPGTFFLFFPGEAHRPGIGTAAGETDKKLVIKIRYVR